MIFEVYAAMVGACYVLIGYLVYVFVTAFYLNKGQAKWEAEDNAAFFAAFWPFAIVVSLAYVLIVFTDRTLVAVVRRRMPGHKIDPVGRAQSILKRTGIS